MKQALLLKFKGAAKFEFPNHSKDRVVSGGQIHDRRTFPVMMVPLDTLAWQTVANVVYVLMSERPVPTIRKSIIPRCPELDEMAKGSYCKVECTSCDECFTVKKLSDRAWNPVLYPYHLNGKRQMIKGGYMYWSRFRRFLGEPLYAEIIELLKRRAQPVYDPVTTPPPKAA